LPYSINWALVVFWNRGYLFILEHRNPLIMKKNIAICFLFIASVLYVFAQKDRQWAVQSTFEHNVFIENQGQCNSSVLYYSTKGSDKIYFSSSSITFEYDSISKDEEGTDEREDKDKLKKSPQYLSLNWVGANTNAMLEVQNEVSEYFTYPNPVAGMPSLLAHAWSKLIYRNIYNNIDIEFYYPEKGGIEYNIIAHPGADLSVIKMHYTGGKVSLSNGNVSIASPFGVFIDHAPVSRDEKGSVISSSFQVNNNIVSFKTGNYDKSKALIIDPWISTPSFTTTNSAYDIGYDFNGNVYVYGGGASTEYQLQKYNNAGVLQWTFTPTTFPEGGGFNYFYGDLVTDSRNGTCYINAGTDGGNTPGAQIDKVGPSGNIIRNFQGAANIHEMWRMDLDYCHDLLVVAAGDAGSPPYQAYTLDTAFSSGTAINVLGTDSAFHDMALLALDQQGHAYMATSQTNGGSAANDAISNNVLLQLPIPSLSPTAYKVNDNYKFLEIGSIGYYPSSFSNSDGNGMNGMAANKYMVVTYDGASLKKWVPSNGKLEDSIKVSATSFNWGGIDIDGNNNIYVGNGSAVDVYDSSLNYLGAILVSNTVYDLKVAANGLIYVCGKAFVGAYNNPYQSNILSVSFTKPSACNVCDGQATANVSAGSGNYTYQWSNGATTSTITGLCQGVYSVTVTDASTCAGSGGQASDSINIFLPGGPTLNISAQANALCYGGAGGTATVNASGSSGPYTYSWSPSGQTNATATNLSKGIYVVRVTNDSGCYSIDTVIISQPTLIKTSVNISPACSGNNGNATAIVSGGTMPYTYNWAPSGGTSASATGLAAGTYTVSVKDSNGCTQIQTATIITATGTGPTLDPSQTASSCSICSGTASVTASGGTAPYVYVWSNGATSSSVSNLCTGTYVVSVSSAGDSAIVPFYTEDFSGGGTGWTLNISGSGTNGTHANTWVIDNSTPLCNTGNYLHVACSGTNAYYTCNPGAVYDPGVPSFDNSATDIYASSPNISTMGENDMVLSFTYECEGNTSADYGLVSFSSNGGTTWNDQSKKYYGVSTCTNASVPVPAAYNGLVNFRFAFRWINVGKGKGNNPPFAINNISLGGSSLVLGCPTEDSITISCLTGIQQISANSSVNIYPNPSDGSFTVSMQDILNKPVIEIYNVLGQSIFTTNLIKPETKIDLKTQPKGVYFYNILDAKGNKVSSGKLILQ